MLRPKNIKNNIIICIISRYCECYYNWTWYETSGFERRWNISLMTIINSRRIQNTYGIVQGGEVSEKIWKTKTLNHNSKYDDLDSLPVFFFFFVCPVPSYLTILCYFFYSQYCCYYLAKHTRVHVVFVNERLEFFLNVTQGYFFIVGTNSRIFFYLYYYCYYIITAEDWICIVIFYHGNDSWTHIIFLCTFGLL